jgi:hypothetical protein
MTITKFDLLLPLGLLQRPKFKEGEQLRTYSYVAANPTSNILDWSVRLRPMTPAGYMACGVSIRML